MTTWEPIDTAPKDGTSALLLTPYPSGSEAIAVCEWVEHAASQVSQPRKSGWKAMHQGITLDDWVTLDDATHWHPLPAQPVMNERLSG